MKEDLGPKNRVTALRKCLILRLGEMKNAHSFLGLSTKSAKAFGCSFFFINLENLFMSCLNAITLEIDVTDVKMSEV